MPTSLTTKKKIERATAQKKGTVGKTSRNNQVSVSGPYMEILIGGPYVKANGEEFNYGHAALRVVVDGKDTTYDFGRYGETRGLLGSEGDGILRIWSMFNAYITGENSYDRQTIGFVYSLDRAEAQKIETYFTNLTNLARKRNSTRARTIYRLRKDYHPILYNCTTITIGGALQSGKNIMENAEKHAQQRGLTSPEKLAAMTQEKPDHGIFMPADLQSVLEANTACPYEKRNTYGSKR